MNKIILGRCQECDRIVWEDEGKVSQWYMEKVGRCRQCMEAQMEVDFKEMEKIPAQRQLWDALDKGSISEVSKILHGHPQFARR